MQRGQQALLQRAGESKENVKGERQKENRVPLFRVASTPMTFFVSLLSGRELDRVILFVSKMTPSPPSWHLGTAASIDPLSYCNWLRLVDWIWIVSHSWVDFVCTYPLISLSASIMYSHKNATHFFSRLPFFLSSFHNLIFKSLFLSSILYRNFEDIFFCIFVVQISPR